MDFEHVKTKKCPCPYCSAIQEITKPVEGIFPYQTCDSCKNDFYVYEDFSARRLTEEEKREVPREWIQVVEDLQKKKTALVFHIE